MPSRQLRAMLVGQKVTERRPSTSRQAGLGPHIPAFSPSSIVRFPRSVPLRTSPAGFAIVSHWSRHYSYVLHNFNKLHNFSGLHNSMVFSVRGFANRRGSNVLNSGETAV